MKKTSSQRRVRVSITMTGPIAEIAEELARRDERSISNWVHRQVDLATRAAATPAPGKIIPLFTGNVKEIDAPAAVGS